MRSVHLRAREVVDMQEVVLIGRERRCGLQADRRPTLAHWCRRRVEADRVWQRRSQSK